MHVTLGHNSRALAALERAAVEPPFTFVIACDSGAWPDPTAEAIFGQLVRQIAELRPAPAFFANLGDFAGPGTRARHERYLELVDPLPVPSLCVLGNHDLDHASGRAAFAAVHGPANFTFACGHTRFVAIDAAPGADGEIEVGDPRAPRDDVLEFLETTLARADEPHRVVLMHPPPFVSERGRIHPDWAYDEPQREFVALLRRGGVSLVCCAHGLAFDTAVRDGVRVVMSGGGGTGLCSHYRGICTAGEGTPEDRGALFHAVEIEIGVAGQISGRVRQAFAAPGAPPRLHF
jgi:Calcineurin-like phosphoesterase